MLLYVTLASVLTWAAGAPLTYDQRQDGDVNVAADVKNVVFVFAIPQKMSLPLDVLDDFLKTKKRNRDSSAAQDRADHVIEAFVEPNMPYQVEIGENDRSSQDGRAVEVVIAGRRRAGPEPQNEDDEIKLIGAREQCGPDRERDPVTLTCMSRVVEDAPASPEPQKEPIPEPAPEVVPS